MNIHHIKRRSRQLILRNYKDTFLTSLAGILIMAVSSGCLALSRILLTIYQIKQPDAHNDFSMKGFRYPFSKTDLFIHYFLKQSEDSTIFQEMQRHSSLLLFLCLLLLILALVSFAFFTLPVEVSLARYFIRNDYGQAHLSHIAWSFQKQHYENILWVQFYKTLRILIWYPIFILPGIVKTYDYWLVPMLLAENPELSLQEALTLSQKLMDGKKWKAFLLDFSFIGWYLLNGLTFGMVNLVCILPYKTQSRAEFYLECKKELVKK